MKLRSLIFWPHLIAGMAAGVIILLMSATGVLLTYERELIAWSDRHLQSAPRAGERPLPIETLLSRLSASHGGAVPTALTVAAAPEAPVSVTIGQKTLMLDAYSGATLGEPSQGMRGFMSGVRGWHRWLAVEGEGRPVARAITGWSNLLFLFIVLSGAYLWLPRQWSRRHVRSVAWFRGGLRGKARDFNWHNAIGLWCVVPLAIVIAGALPISFPWANRLVYRLVGDTLPPAAGSGTAASAAGTQTPGGSASGPGAPGFAGFDAAFARAAAQVPGWRTITVRPPAAEAAPLSFVIDRGDAGQPQLRTTVTVARATARVVKTEGFDDQSPGRRLRSVLRFAHTGEVLGLPGQTVAGIASLGACVLAWTGMALAFRRCRAWISRRRDQRGSPAEAAV